MSDKKPEKHIQDLVELLRTTSDEIRISSLCDDEKNDIAVELNTAVMSAIRTALTKTYHDGKDADDLILSSLDMDMTEAADCFRIEDWIKAAAPAKTPAQNTIPAAPETSPKPAVEKTVKDTYGYEYRLIPAWPMASCAGCGQPIENNGYMAICPDCGGLFCEKCVTDGTFSAHDCEE